MKLHAASVCVAIAVSGWSGSIAFGQQAGNGVAGVIDEDLPAEVREILQKHEAESQEIRRTAEQEITVHRQKAIKRLHDLEEKFNREQKVDEAVAVREKLRQLRLAHLKPRPNPGNLIQFSNRIGQTFYFDVIGDVHGAVWGSDVYTLDSTLAVAAVHAGVLKTGQRGMIRVTIVESPERHEGSEKNEVHTGDWGPFTASYKVRRPLATDENTNESPAEAEAGAAGLRARRRDINIPFR